MVVNTATLKIAVQWPGYTASKLFINVWNVNKWNASRWLTNWFQVEALVVRTKEEKAVLSQLLTSAEMTQSSCIFFQSFNKGNFWPRLDCVASCQSHIMCTSRKNKFPPFAYQNVRINQRTIVLSLIRLICKGLSWPLNT